MSSVTEKQQHQRERVAYQSPQSVMSTTNCWAPKNSGMSHDDEGHAADGLPHDEMSIESVAVVTDAGTSARCR